MDAFARLSYPRNRRWRSPRFRATNPTPTRGTANRQKERYMTDTTGAPPTLDALPQFGEIAEHMCDVVSLHAFLWEWRALTGPVSGSIYNKKAYVSQTAHDVIVSAAQQWKSASTSGQFFGDGSELVTLINFGRDVALTVRVPA